MSSKKAIVIGVGPEAGLGARLAQRFASLGLHVFVAGRTQADLDRVVRSITTNDGIATAVVTELRQVERRSGLRAAREDRSQSLFDDARERSPLGCGIGSSRRDAQRGRFQRNASTARTLQVDDGRISGPVHA